MDGLASLAAAANLVELQSSTSNIGSPLKRKTSFKSSINPSINNNAINSPKKRKKSEDNETSKEYQTSRVELPRPENTDNRLVERLTLPLSTNLRLRSIHEWFYPTLDRDYFDENEFIGCLQQLGLHKYTALTRSQWSYLRCILGSKIGRPRRFSPAFLASEREKLHRYRQSVRALQFGYNTSPFRDFPYQIYDPVDVGDCVTVYHIPTASLQRGLVLSLHSYSPNAVEYLIQYDSLDLGHGIVSDELIAIHGDVPLRYQKKRIYGDSNTQNVAWSTTEEADSDRGTVNSSLNDVQLAHNTPHSLSSSTRETLEELWGKCLEESLTLLEELLTSSSLSLPPPPDLSRLTSSNQSGGSNVSTDGKSFLLLSSTDIKCENEVNQIDDDTIEELLQPLVASLMFFKNALSTNTQSSSQSDPFFPSSIQLDQTFISEMHHFLIEKIHQVYGISSTSTSLSQLYENILKCLLPKSPVPQSYRSGSLFNRPIPRSIPSSESTLGPIRGQNPAES